MAAHLARIDLYPVKSLAGIAVPKVSVLASGALAGDRAYALFDQQDRFVNAKRYAQIHQVRSRFQRSPHPPEPLDRPGEIGHNL
jgi:uncharacterized protein YcbX